MSGAFDFAKKHAICTEESYPYTAKGGSCKASTCTVGIAQGKVLGYKGLAPLARLVPGTEKELMSAIAQQPVSVGIEAASKLFQHYKSGACKKNPMPKLSSLTSIYLLSSSYFVIL